MCSYYTKPMFNLFLWNKHFDCFKIKRFIIWEFRINVFWYIYFDFLSTPILLASDHGLGKKQERSLPLSESYLHLAIYAISFQYWMMKTTWAEGNCGGVVGGWVVVLTRIWQDMDALSSASNNVGVAERRSSTEDITSGRTPTIHQS